jgi:hypothetical protein
LIKCRLIAISRELFVRSECMAKTASRSRRAQDPEAVAKTGVVSAKVQEVLENLTVAELKAVISSGLPSFRSDIGRHERIRRLVAG